MTLKYRPEIDGLRAIAVLAVVFYHAEFLLFGEDFMPGGFLGVDIFFVISGYLITSIILKELNGKGFSFTRFYERRARRILPALFTVIITSFPFAWHLMLPKALMEYAHSILWALGFSANFYFWQEDSYTAEPSLLKPFLHTWSLSIEEQFYFLFPVLLILFFKYRKQSVGTLIISVSLISFALAELLNQKYVDSSFYLLHTRAWELMAGSLMAYLEQKWGERKSSPLISQWAPLAGLILLLTPMFWLKDSMPHPSHFTIPAILGTCLVIWFCKPQGLWTKFLGTRPMVAVGLISYSLYLWHFPIFAFARIQKESLTPIDKWGLIILSIILAIGSYYLVEQPTRNKKRLPLPLFLKGLGATFFGIATVLIFFNSTKGVPSRFSEINKIFQAAEKINVTKDGKDCHSRPIEEFCEFIIPNAKGVVLNIGDSHANVLGATLKERAHALGYSYVHMTTSSCPFVLGIYAIDNGKVYRDCNPEFQKKWQQKISSYKNPIAFYAGRFPLYFSGKRFDNQLGGVEPGNDFYISTEKNKFLPQAAQQAVVKTLEWLKTTSQNLFLVYPTPEVGWHVPKKVKAELKYFPRSQWKSQFEKLEIKTEKATFDSRTEAARSLFDGLTGNRVTRLYPERLLCDANHCRAKNEKQLYYWDDDHISPVIADKLIGTGILRRISQ